MTATSPSDPAEALPGPALGHLRPLLGLAAALVVVLTLAVTLQAFNRARSTAQDTLRAVAELRRAQVLGWLDERRRPLSALAGNAALQRQVQAWVTQGDAAAPAELQARLEELRSAVGAVRVTLRGPDGQRLAVGGDEEPDLPATAQELARDLKPEAGPVHTGVYRPDPEKAQLRLDLMAALGTTGATLVISDNPTATLLPLLQRWPGAATTGQTTLWRAQGPQLVLQNELRDAPDTAGTAMPQPLAESPLLAARLLRDQAKPGELASGADPHGEDVMAVGHRVGDTGWAVVAMVDRLEAEAPAWRTAGWSLAVAATLLLALGAAAWVERRGLAQVEGALQRRRRADEIEGQQLLRAVAEHSMDAVFAKDLQGSYTFISDAAATELARSPDAVLGSDDHALYPRPVADTLVANDRRVLQAGSVQRFEEDVPTVQGLRHRRTLRGPLRDERGEAVGVFGISHDVTELRQATQALQAQEARGRALLAALDEAVLLCAPDGTVLEANPAAEALLGAPREALLRDGPGAGGWRVAEDERWPVARVAGSGQAERDLELHATVPGRGERWLRLRAEPVLDDTGSRVAAVAVVIADRTEQHHLAGELALQAQRLQQRAESGTAELRAAQSQLAQLKGFVRAVTDALPAAVSYWDAEARCRFANRGYVQWLGRPADAVVGRPAAELLGPARAEAQRLRLDAARRGQVQVYDREGLRDGRRQVHRVHCVPDRREDGTVQGVFEIAVDVGALKDAEAELLQLRDLAGAAERARQSFLSGMGSRLREPLAALLGFARLARDQAGDEAPRHYLDALVDTTHILRDLIDATLELSELESGALALEARPFSLDRVLADSLAQVPALAAGGPVQAIVDVDSVPDALVGDGQRLKEVLAHLLANAARHTERGWVRLAAEVLADDGDALQLRLVVEDTGAGIAPERLPTLFQAFEALGADPSQRHRGAGLGLARSRRVVQLMGGQIGVDSQPGAGSRFWIMLTLRKGTGAAARVPGGRRVLLVDAVPEARAALARRLRALGLQVDEAEGRDAALRQLAQARHEGRRLDAVLVDAGLAAADAGAALQALRAGGHAGPLLVLTAPVPAGDRPAEASDHLARTAPRAELADALRRWLAEP